MARKILVTGGAGFIGGHVAEAHVNAGDRVWIVDDMSSGKPENVPDGAELVQCDIRDDRVRKVFEDAGGFDVISHHAAQIDVRKSVADPRFDAAVNIDGLLNIVEHALEFGCGRFVFVSSGGVVYGEPDIRPTPEETAKRPLSPYGVTKLTGEHYLHYYAVQHGLDYVALRYSNVYGPRQDPHGEAGVVAIFCSRILAGQPLTIFGDGEQTRDYVYVGDVVGANLVVEQADLPSPSSIDARGFNVGTSRETSVNELARTLMTASGREVEVAHAPARVGELQHSCLANGRIEALGWSQQTSLHDGLAETYAHIAGREVLR